MLENCVTSSLSLKAGASSFSAGYFPHGRAFRWKLIEVATFVFNRATLPLKGKLIVYVAVSHARHLTQDPCHMLTGLTAINTSFDVLQPSLGIRVPKHQKQKSLENKISLSAFIPTVNDGDFPPKKLND